MYFEIPIESSRSPEARLLKQKGAQIGFQEFSLKNAENAKKDGKAFQ